MTDLFRCSVASRTDGERLAGTAPTQTAFLLVEYAGAWGVNAVADSRLPDTVKARLGSLGGVNVMLIRRHGGITGLGVRIFTVHVTPTDAHVETTVLDGYDDLLALDLDSLVGHGRVAGLRPYDGDLHLVCTNGSRDLCCAEVGRPTAAAVSAQWPEETWECTHLGGHRFSATLLTFPSALCLGRLDPESAVLALEEVEVGRHPVGFSRGRAGVGGAEQVAQLHAVELDSLDDLGDVYVLGSAPRGERDTAVDLVVDGRRRHVVVRRTEVSRRQSCGDSPAKPAASYEVITDGPFGARV